MMQRELLRFPAVQSLRVLKGETIGRIHDFLGSYLTLSTAGSCGHVCTEPSARPWEDLFSKWH